MSRWPQYRSTHAIHPRDMPQSVIRCALSDQILADLPVSVLYFFATAPDEHHLARGLARALDLLPAFAGRLRTRCGALEIVCGPTGVAMDVYEVDDTLADAMARATLPACGFVDHVAARDARDGGRPLLTVRLTLLSDGGAVLGLSWHHAVGDLQSFMVLMRAWSAAVDGAAPPEVLVASDRDVFLDSVLPAEDCGRPGLRVLDSEEAAALGREVDTALRANRMVQVYFTDAEVAAMRAAFTAKAGRGLSANDVLCAHVVTAMRALDEDPESRRLTMPVDLRRRLGLIPGVLGNLLGEIHLTCAPRAEPEALAAQIRAAVEDFAGDHLNLRANLDFLRALGHDRLRDCAPLGFDPPNKTLTVSNWTRYGLYDICFDGHRPVLFCPAATLQLPWVAWLVEGFDAAGYLLTVVLPARLAGRLRTEPGQAALHAYRPSQEELPPSARALRKLA